MNIKKHKAEKDILYISISSFILVVLWIGFNLYHAHVTTTIEPSLQLQIEPIEPAFDTQVIQKLKGRQNIAPVFELDGVGSESSETEDPPATQITQSPVSTQSATLPPQPEEETLPEEIEPIP